MPQDALRELLDLAAIRNFYLEILEERLGHPVPAHEVKSDDPATLSITLYRWLSLLDLAISPVMVRDALQKRPPREQLEALLRMYILRGSPLDVDRDKADFLATYLYRNPPAWRASSRPQNTETADYSFAADFEEELKVILANAEVAEPPREHKQLVRELDFIREEVEDMRHFDQLTDSRLVQRVRELKATLRASFYHPSILSRVASYNAFFGRRFDELFHAATGGIKEFAEQVQQGGGSIMSRVEGDIIVKNLTEVEEAHILSQEYGRAQEHFHEVAKLKKVVDQKRRARGAALSAAAAGVHLGVPGLAGRAGAGPPLPPQGRGLADIEESKLRGTMESIQHFVRAAEAGSAGVVPLRNINIGLSVAEVDAFRGRFHGEKSFRSDFAAIIMRMICLAARMQAEIIDYQERKNSAYLWKPHADALRCLEELAEEALSKAANIGAVAEQRGLRDKITALKATEQKLQKEMQMVNDALRDRV